ncbi:MAG: hypothetical protein IJ222_05255 [Bacteroidales bacterium]|nr:hypothetical protein [Bacteroidales bacterium]
MRRKDIIRILILVISCVACNKAGTPGAKEKSFIPGDCLVGNTLIYDKNGVNDAKANYYYDYNEDAIVFWFSLDMNVEKKSVADGYRDYKYVPTADTFHSFGTNSYVVKNNYERIWEDLICSLQTEVMATSVFYNGGLTLTANKVFGGKAPGENLASLLELRPVNRYDYFYKSGGVVRIPLSQDFSYEYMVPSTFALMIPCGIYKRKNEAVTMTLDIPVRIVYYLSWLNAKVVDPDISMPYKDEILHCEFTIGSRLAE